MPNYKRKKKGKKIYTGYRNWKGKGENFSDYSRRVAADMDIDQRERPGKSSKYKKREVRIVAHVTASWIPACEFTWSWYPSMKAAQDAIKTLRRKFNKHKYKFVISEE